MSNSAVDKKAESLRIKSDEVRRAFNLPDTESVIQDYHCSMNHKGGRMYITANYIAWMPTVKLGATDFLLPFRRIKTMKKDKSALVFDNAITIDDEDNVSSFFSSFMKRDETYNLLDYLWKHPPMYIDFESEDDELITKKTNLLQQQSRRRR